MNAQKESVPEGRKSFQCEICDLSYSQKQGMQRHMVVVHEGKKLFKCKICDKSFSHKSSLNTYT